MKCLFYCVSCFKGLMVGILFLFLFLIVFLFLVDLEILEGLGKVSIYFIVGVWND